MASWDSIGTLDRKLKIKHRDVMIPLSYRIVYDTPNFVSYSIILEAENLKATKLKFDLDDANFLGIVELKSWSKENERIDAREMDDSDVYDLFSEKIGKFLLKLSTEGMTVKTINNRIKNY